MQHRDRNVASLSLFLLAALPWPGCAIEEPTASSRQNGLSMDGGASHNASPLPDERRPRGSDGGSFLVCDPEDQRYCKVSRPEDSVPCAERLEDLAGRLNCGQLPGGAHWYIHQGPTCVMARWIRQQHEEQCVYNAKTGKLIASSGRDACGLYCGGLRRVEYGDAESADCGNTLIAAGAECKDDGTEVPLPPEPRPGIDARRVDAPPRRPIDARNPDAVNVPPPPPWPPAPWGDGGVPPPPPLYDAQPPILVL